MAAVKSAVARVTPMHEAASGARKIRSYPFAVSPSARSMPTILESSPEQASSIDELINAQGVDASPSISPRRIRICYQDEALRMRSQDNAKKLIASAASADSNGSSTSALLAKRALKYRKVLDRMTGVDVNDPAFDVSKFLGVDWEKTPSQRTV